MTAEQATNRTSGGGVRVNLLDASGLLEPGDVEWLATHTQRAADLLFAGGDLSLKLVRDEEMARNHEEFTGVEGTTDVLTFDLGCEPGPDGRVRLDADIMACVDEAERQSRLRGHAVRRELLLYVVHGLLHCLGEDDHDEEAARAMHAREDEILAGLGVGPTFARGERGVEHPR